MDMPTVPSSILAQEPSREDGRNPWVPAALAAAKRPERVVGLGFRCWMTAYKSRDASCCQRALDSYATEIGADAAKAITPTLCGWVHTIHSIAAREIEIYPQSSAGFCRDECLAISMIAACQRNAAPAVRACAFALTAVGSIYDIVESASELGQALGRSGIVFGEASIALAVAAADAGTMPRTKKKA